MGEEKRKKKWIKTLQFLAAYLVAAWTFLQFLDWILTRYDISPNWVDVFLWLFIGIVPSLAIYFYNQERLSAGILKLREKILFPLNLILLIAILYFAFGNSDLGATTKEISFTNDEGNLATQLITKEEFRIGLPIFKFESINKDSTYIWLEQGISELIYQDITQDKNISPFLSDSEGTVNKVTEARIFNNYYLDGTYEVLDSIYSVTPRVRDAKNGKLIAEQTFEGTDLLNLLDEVSIYVRENIGITEIKRDFYIDLNLNEFYSNSLEAIKYNLQNNFQKAQDIDPEFSMSYLENASQSIRFSLGEETEKTLINLAYKYSNKLPLQRQLEIRILRHIAFEEWEVAEKLLKLQLEIDPSNETYNQLLYSVYGETKQTDAYMERTQERFNKNRSIDNGRNLINASLVSGNYQEVISAIKGFEIVQPNNPDLFSFKLRPELLKGDIESAKNTQERTKLIHPNWKNFTKPFDSVIAYLSKNKATKRKLEKFTGRFRSQNSEQIYEFWMEDERLLAYISNQELKAPILAGDNKILIGSYMNRVTTSIEFLRDRSRNYYATKNIQYSFSNTNIFWYWLYDEAIRNAEKALVDGDLGTAEILYKKAIEMHPEHFFLKLALQHVLYIKSISKEDVLKQYASITGTYKARKFWIEDEKLYYERKGLTKHHLFPISEDTYISLERYDTQYGFESNKNGDQVSTVYSYNNELKTWEKLFDNSNYLTKDN